MNTLKRFSQGMQTALFSVVMNMFLAATKIVAGLLGNSYALVSDGIESLMDIFSSTVVWGGIKIGSLPPDENHPFGHGRAESLAAMMVSATLLAVAVGIAIQSVKEIFVPHHAPAPFTLIVLIAVIVIKEWMYRYLLKTGHDLASSSLKADAWHSRSDALTSLAAFIGISIALMGGKGYENADDWAALFASGVIFFNGSRLLKAAVSEIMDEAVSEDFEQDLKSAALSVAGVAGIEKCRIRKSGMGYFVEIHVMVNGAIPVSEGHRIGHDVKAHLIKIYPQVVDIVTHIEPS